MQETCQIDTVYILIHYIKISYYDIFFNLIFDNMCNYIHLIIGVCINIILIIGRVYYNYTNYYIKIYAS